MNENTQGSEGKVSARRRLIRGAFATPAVLTLYSGSALATSSSKCLVKQNLTPVTGEVVTSTGAPTTDTYLRVQLHMRLTDQYWLSGASIASFAGASSVVANGQYKRFGALTTGGDSANYNKLFGTATSTPGSGLTLSNKWAALRIDSTGTLVGVGATGSGSAVGSSCWTSLKA